MPIWNGVDFKLKIDVKYNYILTVIVISTITSIIQVIGQNILLTLIASVVISLIINFMVSDLHSVFGGIYISFAVSNVINYFQFEDNLPYSTVMELVLPIMFLILQIIYIISECRYINNYHNKKINLKWNTCVCLLAALVLFVYKLFISYELFYEDTLLNNDILSLSRASNYLVFDVFIGVIISLCIYIIMNSRLKIDKLFYIKLIIPMIIIHSQFYDVVLTIIFLYNYTGIPG